MCYFTYQFIAVQMIVGKARKRKWKESKLMKEYAKVHQKDQQVSDNLPAADSLKAGFCHVSFVQHSCQVLILYVENCTLEFSHPHNLHRKDCCIFDSSRPCSLTMTTGTLSVLCHQCRLSSAMHSEHCSARVNTRQCSVCRTQDISCGAGMLLLVCISRFPQVLKSLEIHFFDFSGPIKS